MDINKKYTENYDLVQLNIEKQYKQQTENKREFIISKLDDIAYPKKQKFDKLIQKNTNRCWSCNKKIGLTGIKCRCDYYFCSKHRYPEEHDCNINYQDINKIELKKSIVKCSFKKIDYI